MFVTFFTFDTSSGSCEDPMEDIGGKFEFMLVPSVCVCSNVLINN